MDWSLEQAIRETAPGKPIQAIVLMRDQVDLAALTAALDEAHATRQQRHRVVVESLMKRAAASQAGILEELESMRATGRVASFTPLWITNAIALEAEGAELRLLAGRSDVDTVVLDFPISEFEPIEGSPRTDAGGGTSNGLPAAELNLQVIHVPEVWFLGFDGEGVLVSSIDTGVRGSHEALQDRWRGLDPAYAGHSEWAWLDLVSIPPSPQPVDHDSGPGHGTHTMGIICGGPPGMSIGVAPGAQWIHAAINPGSGGRQGTTTKGIAALQWTADPDGDPATVFDVPWVCSNSWGILPGGIYGADCYPAMWSAIDAAEAAGVAVVWASGNFGPGTVPVPADRATDEVRNFSVGNFDHHTSTYPIHSTSSGAIVVCTPDGSDAVKPEVAAPGVQVLSSVKSSSTAYQALGGTSMACPHVAGILALMFDANPYLTVPQAKQMVLDTAIEDGDPGDDIRYGRGRVDALNAVQAALAIRPIVVPDDFPTIQQAVDASSAGGKVLVVDGVYTGTGNRRIVVNKSLTIVRAGDLPHHLNIPTSCVVDCQDLDVGFVITGAGTTVVLEDLTIQHGFADTASGGASDSGGGVRVENSASAILRRCTIQDSRAFHDGAGIAFDNGGSLLVENCVLQRNTIPFVSSNGRGGGVFASCGAATTEVRIVDSLLTANTSNREGGAIAVVDAGGAPSTIVEVRNCTIANNRVTGGTAGVFGGGAFFAESPSGNTGWGLRNCILWGNAVDDAPPSTFGDQLAFASLGSTFISFDDLQGGMADVANLNPTQWGSGNIALSPNFVNGTSNFHLLKSSPCINAGDPAYVPYPGETDIDGGARILNGRVDMGSDEKLLTIGQP